MIRTRVAAVRPQVAWVLLFASTTWCVSLTNAAPPVSASPAINKMCPVMTEEDADPKITLTYLGHTVAFCCDRCRSKFEANPLKYADRLPRLADDSASGDAPPHVDTGVEHGQDSNSANTDHHSEAADADTAPKSSGGHDHGGSEGASEDGRTPLLGRLHPVIIHFPVAGIPLALLGFGVWVLTGRAAFAKADVLPLAIGTLAAVAAVITGNIAHDSMQFSASMHVIVERHQLISTTVMVVCLLLSALRVWRWESMTGRWRWGYGGGLLFASALLGITGYLGGSLVFGPDHLAW